eukprot:scaffold26005_cov38-Phaeocystis_antarctica.AAC.4
MSSAHRRLIEKRASRGSRGKVPPRLAAPRRAGTHRTHSTNAQLKSNCARNHAGRTRSAVQGLDPRGSSPQQLVYRYSFKTPQRTVSGAAFKKQK